MSVNLVPYDDIFLEKSWYWLNDPEIKTLTNTGTFTKKQQVQWFENLANQTDYKIWGMEIENEPAGVFGIKNIKGEAGEYWGYIGEKQFWGKGYGKIVMDLVIQNAISLSLNRLYLNVIQENERAIKLYNKMGFVPIDIVDGFIIMEKFLR